MSFNVEILEEKKNPLIDRLELKVKVDYFGKGTPNRLDVKKKIAALKSSNENLTIIRKLRSYFGEAYAIGKIFIYGNVDDLQFFEPFHIKARNLPKETRIEIHNLKKKKEPYKHLLKFE